jgi:hypothetical protein
MKRKSAILLILTLVIVLTSAPKFMLAVSQPSSPKATSPTPQNHDEGEKNAQRTIAGPYRLTYTFKEMDGNKPIGFMHYAMVLDADAGRATLKMGTKVPIVTGEYKENSSPNSLNPISYIDLGMNFQVALRQFPNGLELRSHISESAVDTEQPNPTDPVIRQTDFENSVLLNEIKPVILGTVDMPGTTHVLQIQVEVSKLP